MPIDETAGSHRTRSDSRSSPRQAHDHALLGRISVPSSLDAPHAARAAVAQWMPASLPRTLLLDAQLLISELVTNSVRHAAAAAGTPIIVTAGTSDGAVWFDVADAGERGGVARRPPQGTGGMGLNIVHTGATRWGTSDGDGTHVWFELALPTDCESATVQPVSTRRSRGS
jgi:anti-sigma regulatory factor (Ser/Thr protein kinase)